MDAIEQLLGKVNSYLNGGGLWNPELADHYAVRDLLIEVRDELAAALAAARSAGETPRKPNERRECSQCQTSWQGPGQQPAYCPRCGSPAKPLPSPPESST